MPGILDLFLNVEERWESEFATLADAVVDVDRLPLFPIKARNLPVVEVFVALVLVLVQHPEYVMLRSFLHYIRPI